MEVAASDVLVPMLADGRLDFALCRLSTPRLGEVFEEQILTVEPVSFVTRKEHPLQRANAPCSLVDMVKHDWVMAPEGTILRTTVERALRDGGLKPPTHIFTTSSFLFTLAMLRRTNSIAPVASAVASSFAGPESADLAILTCEQNVAVETYSLLTLKDKTLTPAAEILCQGVLETHEASMA